MKPYLILILLAGLIACNNNSTKVTTNNAPQQPVFDCNSITNKEFLYHIADSLITNHKGGEYFSLRDFDTADVFITEDYFTDNKTKTTLVLMGVEGNPSDGTGQNLLILFSCGNTYRIINAAQSGTFTPLDIRDLNGDGVKEIVVQSSQAYEGTCSDLYEVISFKDEKKQTLFSRQSTSDVNCGIDLSERYKTGDTVEHKFDCSLINNKTGTYNIRQIETIKINNGGTNDSEVVGNLIIKTDTTQITLK